MNEHEQYQPNSLPLPAEKWVYRKHKPQCLQVAPNGSPRKIAPPHAPPRWVWQQHSWKPGRWDDIFHLNPGGKKEISVPINIIIFDKQPCCNYCVSVCVWKNLLDIALFSSTTGHLIDWMSSKNQFNLNQRAQGLATSQTAFFCRDDVTSSSPTDKITQPYLQKKPKPKAAYGLMTNQSSPNKLKFWGSLWFIHCFCMWTLLWNTRVQPSMPSYPVCIQAWGNLEYHHRTAWMVGFCSLQPRLFAPFFWTSFLRSK